MSETYRDFVIHYVNPPIPIRTMDWGFYHKDYDGEGDNRHGYGPSVEDCKAQIDDWWLEQGAAPLVGANNTHIAETFNEYGTPVSMFRCVGCSQIFTICPAVPEDKWDQWIGCMSADCSTYDETRDGDKLFDAGMVRRAGDRSHFKCITPNRNKDQPNDQ